jgi:hypothetical protein
MAHGRGDLRLAKSQVQLSVHVIVPSPVLPGLLLCSCSLTLLLDRVDDQQRGVEESVRAVDQTCVYVKGAGQGISENGQ